MKFHNIVHYKFNQYNIFKFNFQILFILFFFTSAISTFGFNKPSWSTGSDARSSSCWRFERRAEPSKPRWNWRRPRRSRRTIRYLGIRKHGNSRPKWNWKIICFLSQLHLGPSSGDDPRGRGERRPEESALRGRAQGGHARIVRRLGGRGFRAVQGG